MYLFLIVIQCLPPVLASDLITNHVPVKIAKQILPVPLLMLFMISASAIIYNSNITC